MPADERRRAVEVLRDRVHHVNAGPAGLSSFSGGEGILMLATLAQKWKLRLAPNQRVPLLITLRPRDGMRMIVEPSALRCIATAAWFASPRTRGSLGLMTSTRRAGSELLVGSRLVSSFGLGF